MIPLQITFLCFGSLLFVVLAQLGWKLVIWLLVIQGKVLTHVFGGVAQQAAGHTGSVPVDT